MPPDRVQDISNLRAKQNFGSRAMTQKILIFLYGSAEAYHTLYKWPPINGELDIIDYIRSMLVADMEQVDVTINQNFFLFCVSL